MVVYQQRNQEVQEGLWACVTTGIHNQRLLATIMLWDSQFVL